MRVNGVDDWEVVGDVRMDELYEYHRRYDAAYRLLLENDKKRKLPPEPPLKPVATEKENIHGILAKEAEERQRSLSHCSGDFSGDWYLQKAQWEGVSLLAELRNARK